MKLQLVLLKYPFINLAINIVFILILRLISGYSCLPVVQAEGLDSESIRAIHDAVYISSGKDVTEIEQRRRYVDEYKRSMAYAKDKYDAIQEIKKSKAVLDSIPKSVTPTMDTSSEATRTNDIVKTSDASSSSSNGNVNTTNASVFKPSEHTTDKPIIIKSSTILESVPSVPKNNSNSNTTNDIVKTSDASSSSSNSNNLLIFTGPQVNKMLDDYFKLITPFDDKEQLKELIKTSLTYVKSVVPSDTWSKNQSEISSNDSPINSYIDKVSQLAPLKTEKDVMSLIYFRTAATTYNVVQMFNLLDKEAIVEKIFISARDKYMESSKQ